jgi:hypothetical protein
MAMVRQNGSVADDQLHTPSLAPRRQLSLAVPGCRLSRRAAIKLDEIRDRLPFVDGTTVPVVNDCTGNVRIWTFAGARANAALGQAIPGFRTNSDDFCITIKSENTQESLDAISSLHSISIQPSLSAQMISDLKFSVCIPEPIAKFEIELRLLDKIGIDATLTRQIKLVLDPG